MPSCSHSCTALALERAKAHMAITAAGYTRQETLPALLLRYCPIFSLGWSAFVFPLKTRILELRRPSRYMEASYMEARVYLSTISWSSTKYPPITVISREYFENILLKFCNIARIFIKLLERFLKYCKNLATSVQNIINEILLQY